MKMQAVKNKKIARKFWSAIWEERNLDRALNFISDQIVYHSPKIEVHGKEKYIALVKGYMNVFEDTQFSIEDQIAEADHVFSRILFSGIHSGDFGEIPPTHKRIRFQVMNLLQIVDGKIVNEWEVYDELGFMQQLGMKLVQREHTHYMT